MYFVADKTNAVSLYSQAMDAKGAPRNSPALTRIEGTGVSQNLPAPSDTRVPLQALPIYFAPDGNRAISVGEWGGRSMLHPDSGKIEPLFGNRLDPPGLFFNWGPDSRHVLIRAEQNYADVGLWMVDINTGEHVTLHDEGLSPIVDGAAISPDGQKVVYTLQKKVFSSECGWLMPMAPMRTCFSPRGRGSILPLRLMGAIAFMGDGLMVVDADGRYSDRQSLLNS
jgi:hypothetical protein